MGNTIFNQSGQTVGVQVNGTGRKMTRVEAAELLKHYDSALFDKYKDWGDHPYQTEKIDIALARLRELIIQNMTGDFSK